MSDEEQDKTRMLEMLDDLRANVAEGKVSGIAFVAHLKGTGSVIVGSKSSQIITLLGAVELLRANMVAEIQSVEIIVPPVESRADDVEEEDRRTHANRERRDGVGVPRAQRTHRFF